MTAPRPFRVLGLQQVAMGAPERSGLRNLWQNLLGTEKQGEYESPSENVREDVLRLGVGPFSVELDLMEPYAPDSKPRVDRPALHHVGVWVDELEAAVKWLTAKGVRFTPGGIRSGASGHLVCFIHPVPSAEHPIGGEGVLIELVQAPPEVIDAYDRATASFGEM